VLARLETVHGVGGVPEVGGGDDDRVEILLLVEHLAVVFVAVDVELVFLEDSDRSLLVVLRPDVTHRPEAEPRDPQHGIEENLPLGSRPEEGHVHLRDVVGRGGLPLGGGSLLLGRIVLALLAPGSAEEAQRGDGGQAQEDVAAVELLPAGAGAVFLVLLVAGHGLSPSSRGGRRPRPRRSG
jgi:hypothetical protein